MLELPLAVLFSDDGLELPLAVLLPDDGLELPLAVLFPDDGLELFEPDAPLLPLSFSDTLPSTV